MTASLRASVPVLRASDFTAAEAFYRDKLGFTLDWDDGSKPASGNPVYASFSREGATIHVSSHTGDGRFGAAVYTAGVDSLFTELIGRGVKIDLAPYDQTWGRREMYVKDPDGNTLRFVQTSTAED